MTLKAGDPIDVGAPMGTKRTRRFPDTNTEQSFVTQAVAYINTGVFTQYETKGGKIWLKTNEYLNHSHLILDFSYYPLGLGALGERSYMRPEHLPFSHPGCIVGLQATQLCTHRLSGEKCRLRIAENFYANGEYTLTPINGKEETRTFTSQKWGDNYREFLAHLESLKGSTLCGKGRIRGFILYDTFDTENIGRYVSSLILPNNDARQIQKEAYVIVVFEDLTLAYFPTYLIEKP